MTPETEVTEHRKRRGRGETEYPVHTNLRLEDTGGGDEQRNSGRSIVRGSLQSQNTQDLKSRPELVGLLPYPRSTGPGKSRDPKSTVTVPGSGTSQSGGRDIGVSTVLLITRESHRTERRVDVDYRSGPKRWPE